MKQAIISDVHGNSAALEAVLEDISQQGVDEIIFLGDAVGYGPSWLEVIQMLSEKTTHGVKGNHDWAVINSPFMFSLPAEATAEWTKHEIGQSPNGEQALNYLNSLPESREDGDILYVHASPAEQFMKYILPSSSRKELGENFDEMEHIAFIGHSHVPHFWEDEEGIATVCEDPEIERLHQDRKYIINVGAVGQARKGDPRACYVIHEGDRIEYRKVAYDLSQHTAALRASNMNKWFAAIPGQQAAIAETKYGKDPHISVLDLAGYLAHRIEIGK
tara:strand:- start:1332 stop:2156 length:825 start_codon:yes stop_codon:yes gene_type:complete